MRSFLLLGGVTFLGALGVVWLVNAASAPPEAPRERTISPVTPPKRALAPRPRWVPTAVVETLARAVPPKPGYIRCDLSGDVDVQGTVEFVVTIAESEHSAAFQLSSGEIGPGFVDLPTEGDNARKGTLEVPGYGRVPVVWDDVGCEPITLQRATIVTGQVTPSFGTVYVSGCGGFAVADEDGQFYLEATDTSSCSVSAEREDGPYRTPSDAVEVNPIPGEEVTIALTLPTLRTTGVGVIVDRTQAGSRVTRVRRGSGADLAGIRAGDLILTSDEGPAERPWTGPEGTSIVLELERGPVTVERTFYDDGMEWAPMCPGCGGQKVQERADAWLPDP